MPDTIRKWWPYFVGLVVVLALLSYSNQWQRAEPDTTVSYSQFKALVADGEDDYLLQFAKPVHAVGLRLLTNFCAA